MGSGTPYHSLLNQQCKLLALNEELQDIGSIVHQAVARSRNLEVRSDFSQFPVPQLAKVSLKLKDY